MDFYSRRIFHCTGPSVLGRQSKNSWRSKYLNHTMVLRTRYMLASIPSKEHYSVVSYFVTFNEFEEGSVWDRFLKGDDVFKNNRLKLIANISEGPWIVKTAVGEQAICILGRSLTCRYLQGSNFIEVDVDIGSSIVANAIVHLAIGYITTLTVDLAFLLEGQMESELPEQILGTIRLKKLDLAAAVSVELTPEGATPTITEGTSFQSRLWRSFGQGLSTLMQPAGPAGQIKQDGEAK
uniref:Protein ENHANCED DISEASE RESISTANCE 2 C-terminal domain-containing protein n=2 Tax=Physcomitrium patens TaxID=3218 RepID=A0A7I4BHF4_PHYPA